MKFKKILLTGAAGFIGSHVYDLFSEKYCEAEITILDKMTYAANIRNIPQIITNKKHKLIVGDLTDMDICLKATKDMDLVINLAAESHSNSALLYNKFVYSGMALGFWAAFVIGRVRLGEALCEVRQLAMLQSATAGMAFLMTTISASIGGKLSRVESLLDILPFELPLDSAAILPIWASTTLLTLGIICSLLAFRFTLPKITRLH